MCTYICRLKAVKVRQGQTFLVRTAKRDTSSPLSAIVKINLDNIQRRLNKLRNKTNNSNELSENKLKVEKLTHRYQRFDRKKEYETDTLFVRYLYTVRAVIT